VAGAARAPSWRLRAVEDSLVERLARNLGVPPLVARLLAARGHVREEAAAAHLAASLKSLHEPERLCGATAGAKRIARAVQAGETILVHGDYDVDGTCGTALFLRLFELVGARATWHIPHRTQDGYSFGAHSLKKAREVGAGVVLSVDNGTSAHETIAELAALGIDTVVTDHHEPPTGELPRAAAIVNPKLEPEGSPGAYPFRELCGSAVAFKLAWAVCQELSGTRGVRPELKQFLVDAMAYVALATVCDVVPLVGENRVLARGGLKALAASEHAGLRALLGACDLEGQTLSAEDVAFKIGPRLNAAGRMDSAGKALELLLCRDAVAARELARGLEELNQARKRSEAAVLEQALRAAEPFGDEREHPVVVVAGQGWHQGVVGIIAARLVEKLGRPALVIGLDGDRGRGSARSVPGKSVLEAMRGGEALALRMGGHAMAAGCEVEAGNVPALREAIGRRARELWGAREKEQAPLWIDAEQPLAGMTEPLMKQIDRLEPFGQDNEKPVLLARDLRLAEEPRAVGDGSHLMLRLRDGEAVFKAMAFGQAQRLAGLKLGQPLEVAYTPRWNTFRGRTALELVVEELSVCSARSD
jgi:single-stranded-DNA-specific exonuclease